jgi:hypothetical protein
MSNDSLRVVVALHQLIFCLAAVPQGRIWKFNERPFGTAGKRGMIRAITFAAKAQFA